MTTDLYINIIMTTNIINDSRVSKFKTLSNYVDTRRSIVESPVARNLIKDMLAVVKVIMIEFRVSV